MFSRVILKKKKPDKIRFFQQNGGGLKGFSPSLFFIFFCIILTSNLTETDDLLRHQLSHIPLLIIIPISNVRQNRSFTKLN